MTGMLAVTLDALSDLDAKVALDSKTLAEQFYFFTVVIMWLIHAGFMAYEAGVARRKNVMSTAMKNILTIAVVTPAFYYLGWWIYGCMERGFVPTSGAGQRSRARSTSRRSASRPSPGATTWGRTCRTTSPASSGRRSCCSPGRPPRSCPAPSSSACGSRPTCCWPRPRLRGLDPRRRLGLERRRLARDRVRLPRRDRLGGGARRGRRVHARRAVPARPAHRQVREDGRARAFLPHNLHLTLLGLMLIFTGFYAFYAACLVIQSTVFPGWANIYLSPTTLSVDHVLDHDRVRGRVHRRLLREPRRSVLDALGRPCRRDLRLGRRGHLLTRRWSTCSPRRRGSPSSPAASSRSGSGSTMPSGPWPCTASPASSGCSGSASSRGLPDGPRERRRPFGGQMMGIMTFFPLGFLPGT